MPPEDFLKLIYNSKCFVGNSSAAIREGSYLGIPAVSIGDRQKPREHGNNVVFSKFNIKDLNKKINMQIKKKNLKPNNLFGDGFAAKKNSQNFRKC